jgi:hypothetical protein
MTTTQLRITRTPLPPAIVPDDETMWGRHDTYAEVSSGSLTAEVPRFAYWNDRAGCPYPELMYEVRHRRDARQPGRNMRAVRDRGPPTFWISPLCAGQRDAAG